MKDYLHLFGGTGAFVAGPDKGKDGREFPVMFNIAQRAQRAQRAQKMKAEKVKEEKETHPK